MSEVGSVLEAGPINQGVPDIMASTPPLVYRLYAPFAKLLSFLGVIRIFGRHPFLVLRTGVNRLLYRTVFRDKRLIAVKTRPGFEIVIPMNDQGAASILFQREYARSECGALTRLFPLSSCFIDIGCNLGYFSLVAKTCTASDYRVIAVDPNIRMCEIVARSVALNDFQTVEIQNAAVGRQEGRAYFQVDTRLSTSGRVVLAKPEGVGFTAVDVLTLAEIVPKGLGDLPPLIKIDVEGHEVEVLKGGRDLLQSGAIISCEVWRDTTEELLSFVSEYQYRILTHGGRELPAEKLRRIRRGELLLVPCEHVRDIQAVLK